MRRFIPSAIVGFGIFASKSNAAQAGETVGIDRLVMDELPKSSVSACYSGSSKSSSQAITTDSLAVVPTSGATNVQLDFSVGSIDPNTSGKPMVLFLAYSNEKKTTPQIASKNTAYPFLLGGGLQILATYSIQPMTLQAQTAASIGQASNTPSAKYTFTISLDMAKVNPLISSSNNKLYFQAGLMTEEGLSKGEFSSLILSEVDTIEFKSSCSGTSVVQTNSSGKTVNSGSTSVNSTGTSKTSSTSTSSSKTSTSSTSSTSKSSTSNTSNTGKTGSTTTTSTGTKS